MKLVLLKYDYVFHWTLRLNNYEIEFFFKKLFYLEKGCKQKIENLLWIAYTLYQHILVHGILAIKRNFYLLFYFQFTKWRDNLTFFSFVS